MNFEALKKKLSSRKLWTAIVGFVAALGIAIGRPELTAEQTATIIAGCSSLVAYIIGEGIADHSKKE